MSSSTSTGASFLDYVNYFFTGYETADMSPIVLALIKGLHYVIVTFLAVLAQQVFQAMLKGTFSLFDWAAWQSYILFAAAYVLGVLDEAIRKRLHPVFPIRPLRSYEQPTVPDAPVLPPTTVTPLEQQLGKATPPEGLPKVKPDDIPPKT